MHDNTTMLGPSTPRARARARWVAVAAVLVLGFAACGDDDDDAATDQPEAPGDAGGGDDGGDGGAAVAYEVTDFTYQDISAPAGGTIELTNTSGAPHTFTAEDGSFDVDYGSDETATVQVPTEPGEYPFRCEIHASMEATLTVE